MKTVKILGSGCANCNQTETVVTAAINKYNLEFKIEKVDDIQEIMKYNIMSTPALVIDEKVVLKGRVPSLVEVKELLEKATTSTCCTDDSCCADNSDSSCCEDDACCSSESHSKKEACCSSSESNCC